MRDQKPSTGRGKRPLMWTPLMSAGILAISFTASMSGCGKQIAGIKIGNSSTNAPSLTDWNGYYRMRVSSVTMCATQSNPAAAGQSTTKCGNLNDLTVLPDFWGSLLIDPMNITVFDLVNGRAYLVQNPTAANLQGMTINIAQSGAINNQGGAVFTWSNAVLQDGNGNAICSQSGAEGGSGQLSLQTPTAMNGNTIRGAITFSAESTITYTGGSCSAYFQIAGACANDPGDTTGNPTSCGGPSSTKDQNVATQDGIRALFALYVNAGAMAFTDISNLISTSYTVNYH